MKRSCNPPLGPRPKFVLEWERISELQNAIRRTLDANWPLQPELVAEYNELTERLEIDSSECNMMMTQLKELMKQKK